MVLNQQTQESQNSCSIIAVAAGKGGVGKSTMTVNLASALVQSGAKVGIIDADLYGPSMSKMIGEHLRLQIQDEGIIPAQRGNLFFVSLAQFPLGAEGAFVRAPIANQIISDFLEQVVWPKLDFLLIDFPPGTGDIQLTIVQKTSLAGAVLVTTPQQVALLDVSKALKMFTSMQVPILGLVENMSYLEIAGQKHFPFGPSKSLSFCQEHNICFLGQVPLDPLVSVSADAGDLLMETSATAGVAQSYHQVAKALCAQLMRQKKQAPIVAQKLVWTGGTHA